MDVSTSKPDSSRISSPVDYLLAELNGVPAKAKLLKSHQADIKEMEAAGFIAEWVENPPLLRCHTAGFAAMLANDPSRLPNYKTTSDGSDPLTQNAYGRGNALRNVSEAWFHRLRQAFGLAPIGQSGRAASLV